ncbi:MAG: cadmium-translocating P-type ATPase [Luteitalea sp.]|nr:cadmium-translocating P-type ATPase [Luteitalea sp.]
MVSRSSCGVCIEHAESTFRVDGLCCHEEAALLEKHLRRLPGLTALSADVVRQQLRVHHDAARVSVTRITEAVAEAGLRAWPHEEDRARPAVARGWSRGLFVSISGVLVAVGAALGAAAAPRWALAAAFGGAAVAGGLPIVRRALAAVRLRTLDINALMLVAVIGAALVGEWFEGATVVFLFALAQWLEARSMDRVRRSVGRLMSLTPAEAILRRDGQDIVTPVDAIGLGEVIVVRPGEKVPLDGNVADGESDVDQSPVTGESVPVPKGRGSPVFAGTINGPGVLEVRVTRRGRDSTIARIIHLIERAQAQRAPSQAWVDRFAQVYTPAVLLVAAVTAILPPLALGAVWSDWIYRALVLLVIACPCALVISTPVAIVSALTVAARHGVLVKGGRHLERLADVRAIAFDKTGTLTTGRLAVTGVYPIGPMDRATVLRLAAAVEARSEHPIGRAVVALARAEGIGVDAAADFRAWPGRGAEARVGRATVLVGNERLLRERGVDSSPAADIIRSSERRGGPAVLVALRGELVGALALGDQVRAESRPVVTELKRHGLAPIVVLSGDSARAAQTTADVVGADEWYAELLPEDKVDAVVHLKARAGTVLMAGDGVNDAPALAAADVGLAMGVAGTDVALETADVALMGDDLRKLPYAVSLSRATLGTVKANVAFSLGLKAVFLLLAIAGMATLWMAVVADMGASLLVIANGLRLLRFRPTA